jgi:hypothetical protein
MLTPSPIRILHPSIDDYQSTVIIRGVIHNDSLNNLKTDFYQRELLPSTSRKNIRDAIEKGDWERDLFQKLNQYKTHRPFSRPF